MKWQCYRAVLNGLSWLLRKISYIETLDNSITDDERVSDYSITVAEWTQENKKRLCKFINWSNDFLVSGTDVIAFVKSAQ